MSIEMRTDAEAAEPPPGGGASSRARRKWTKEEDEKLRLLVSTWGDGAGRQSNWDKIASSFDGRSSKDCRKRWIRSLDPKLRHGKWSPTEDRILIEARERFGTSWQRISQLIPGRTDDQCAKRYNDVLDPSVQDRLRPWSPDEDEKLLALRAKHGARWQLIAKELPGRTGLVCRNRFRKLARPVAKGDAPAAAVDDAGAAFADTSADPGEPEYAVPGTTQAASYPAGAERSWFTPASPTGSSLSPGSASPPAPLDSSHMFAAASRSYTLSVAGDDARQLLHYELTDALLDKILQYASRERRELHIHQHIYNAPVPGPTPAAPAPAPAPNMYAAVQPLPSPQSRPSSQPDLDQLPRALPHLLQPPVRAQGALPHVLPPQQLPRPALLPQTQPIVPHMHSLPLYPPDATQMRPANTPNERMPTLPHDGPLHAFADGLSVEGALERPSFGFGDAGELQGGFETDDLNFMAFNPS